MCASSESVIARMHDGAIQVSGGKPAESTKSTVQLVTSGLLLPSYLTHRNDSYFIVLARSAE
ncbi:MAG: hypothetical protein AAFN93_10815 [Bacteroidota bacterium]